LLVKPSLTDWHKAAPRGRAEGFGQTVPGAGLNGSLGLGFHDFPFRLNVARYRSLRAMRHTLPEKI
jgi:hypothetical protein